MFEDFNEGFSKQYQLGPEDRRNAFYLARERQDKDSTDAPRMMQNLGTNPTFTTARDLMGISDRKHRQAREAMGMAPPNTLEGKAGHLAGAVAADIREDATRGLWWLLNAPQAVATVVGENVVANANENLYKQDPTGVSKKNERLAIEQGLLNKETKEMMPGVRYDKKLNQYTKRRYEPGAVASVMLPTSLAINSGMGLTNFLGGTDGYTAAVPSKEDLTKTDNVLLEVGAKYILGRTGNLLPWEEFKKVRPDVSKSDYMKYKAFKYDKKTDLNPLDDGQVNLPLGIAKYTNDGIHGAELQFLGRSLPIATSVMPTATAIAGTAMGVRTGRPIRGGIVGGLAGFAAGRIGGELIERERRNRNERALNAPQTAAIDPEGI